MRDRLLLGFVVTLGALFPATPVRAQGLFPSSIMLPTVPPSQSWAGITGNIEVDLIVSGDKIRQARLIRSSLTYRKKADFEVPESIAQRIIDILLEWKVIVKGSYSHKLTIKIISGEFTSPSRLDYSISLDPFSRLPMKIVIFTPAME